VREQELAGAGQGGLALVEYRGEPLEDVRNAGCDLEGDGDVGRGGVGSEPSGVVEQDLVWPAWIRSGGSPVRSAKIGLTSPSAESPPAK
jgi:hypothetical protein